MILSHFKKDSKEYRDMRYKIVKDKSKYNIKTTVSKFSLLRQCIKCKQFKFNRSSLRAGLCTTCHSKKYPEITKLQNKKNNLKRKIKAFKTIQDKIECVRCECNDLRLLEVNHKDGNGRQTDYGKYRNGYGLYQDIVTGKRKTDDLELLCRPCNHIHYLEMKYGKLPMKVVWTGY